MVPESAGASECSAREQVDLGYGIQISFLIPEDTFSAVVFDGDIVRCDERGMLVAIKEVPVRFYGKLLAEKRYLRLMLNMGSPEGIRKITGLVSWLDYHRKGDCGSLNVGFEYVNAMSKGNCLLPIA